MGYAPVVIPTLNRIDHLRSCVDSLSKNIDACKTDLIISLDYPPNEKYLDGYEKVRDYLHEDSWKVSFQSVIIIEQSKNLGPHGNIQYLFSYARSTYDCCIFTEDDNVFSSNFLTYMNKGLEIFKSDSKVIAVCGRKEIEPNVLEGDTAFPIKIAPSYGMGIWFNKEDYLARDIPNILLSRENYKLGKLLSLRKRNITLFNKYVLKVLIGNEKPYWYEGQMAIIDTTRSLYMYLTNHYCIMPVISKSDTKGNDGSGVNMKAIDMRKEEKIMLDMGTDFSFVMNGNMLENQDDLMRNSIIYNQDNEKPVNEYLLSVNSWKDNIKALLGLITLLFRGCRHQVENPV